MERLAGNLRTRFHSGRSVETIFSDRRVLEQPAAFTADAVCRKPRRIDRVTESCRMSGYGTFRTWREVSLESVMRLKADIAEDDFYRERGPTESRLNHPSITRHRMGDRSRARQIGYFPDGLADRQQPLRKRCGLRSA